MLQTEDIPFFAEAEFVDESSTPPQREFSHSFEISSCSALLKSLVFRS